MAAHRPAPTPIAAKAAPTRDGGAGGNAGPAHGLKRAGAIPPFFCGRGFCENGLCGSGLARDGSASPCTDANSGQGRSYTQWRSRRQRRPGPRLEKGGSNPALFLWARPLWERACPRWQRFALQRRQSRPRPLPHAMAEPAATPAPAQGLKRAGAIPPFFCGRGLCGARPLWERACPRWQRIALTRRRSRPRPLPHAMAAHRPATTSIAAKAVPTRVTAPLGRTPCAKRGYR